MDYKTLQFCKKKIENVVPFQNGGQITDFCFVSFQFLPKVEKKKHFPKGIFQWNLAQSRRIWIHLHYWNWIVLSHFLFYWLGLFHFVLILFGTSLFGPSLYCPLSFSYSTTWSYKLFVLVLFWTSYFGPFSFCRLLFYPLSVTVWENQVIWPNPGTWRLSKSIHSWCGRCTWWLIVMCKFTPF